MTDKFEKAVIENRNKFDTLEPEDKMREKLIKRLSGTNKNARYKALLRIAAVLILAAGLFGLIYHFTFPKKIRYGKVTPNIKLATPEGENVNLASLRGKVVLVEFWASWCAVCKDKNCNELIPLYQAYHDKGFEIYGVSVDTKKGNWTNGIFRDQLPWINVSDLKGFKSPITDKYKVTRIPTTYLLDKRGKLIAINLSYSELAKSLNQLLSENNSSFNDLIVMN